MPPWPSDVGNCVVCHAWSSEVGLDSLVTVEPIRLEDVPSQAQMKPLRSEDNGSPPNITGREQLPEGVAALFESECGPCHFAGGEVADVLDFSNVETIQRRATNVLERVEAGEMPPDGGLSDDQRAVLRTWAADLGH